MMGLQSYEQELVRLGKRIKQVRKHRGLTLLELETLSGINDSMLSRYERGLENIGFQIMHRLAKALQVEIKILTDYDGPLPENSSFKVSFPKRSKKRN